MNNHARFSALKQRIGGNREPMGYEHTFGMLRETGWHITPPNADIRRIVSELEFALRLDEEKGGIYTDCVSSALDEAEKALDAEGVLTRTACRAAEEKLLPMADAAKEYAVILCAQLVPAVALVCKARDPSRHTDRQSIRRHHDRSDGVSAVIGARLQISPVPGARGVVVGLGHILRMRVIAFRVKQFTQLARFVKPLHFETLTAERIVFGKHIY